MFSYYYCWIQGWIAVGRKRRWWCVRLSSIKGNKQRIREEDWGSN